MKSKTNYFAHSTAIVESKKIGKSTRIWAFSHIQPQVSIGSQCNIGENCFIENGAQMGKGVTLKNGVCVWEGIKIHDYAFVGPHVTFTNDRHPRSPRLPLVAAKYKTKKWITPIVVGKGCTIGANATLVGPVKLGPFSFVAAGSVVLKDVKPYELVAGNPAKHRGWVDQKGRSVRKKQLRHERN